MQRCDVLIVGAGPAGLFQVFELGLLGLHAHLVDAMPVIGGQCTELYPDKPIYDIPAVPVCTARELTERLTTQIRPFSPMLHLGETVVRIAPGEGRRWRAQTGAGTEFDAGAIVIAGGLGAFAPRRLALPGIDALEGRSVHYKVADADALRGKDVIVAGGGDSALDWALALLDRVRSLVLVHRSGTFRAAAASVARMQALCAQGRMQFLEGDIVGVEGADGRLSTVRVRSRSGLVNRVDAEELLVFWGMHPALGPIADWDLALDRQQIVVDPATFQTSRPGVFAIGDIASYAGKKKLILSAFHEAALCAFAVHGHLAPDVRVPLQYTTTSPLMHQRLGVRENADGDAVRAPGQTRSAGGVGADAATGVPA